MAGETKMIIITSNEDLIQQVTAMTKDNNNTIQSTFFAQLSEIVRILLNKNIDKD